jgi:hypothetical protein
MIVRISGVGQYEVDDACVQKLNELDGKLTDSVHSNNEEEFHRHLHDIITLIEQNGKELGHDTVVPSDVIVPPDDTSIEEAKRFFHDDSLLTPLPA